MLIRKQEKRLSDTPLKWLRYLGIAMVIVIALYYGIRVLDQIKEDQDVETLDVGIHSKSDRESGNDDTSNIAFIDLIHTEDLEVISFIAFQRRFDLNLTPMKHQMISEGARIRKSDTNEIDGYINETNAFKQCEFYHAVNPGVSAALGYCEKRGFWGRITADHGIYDIERVDGDRHRITLVNVQREMEEWRANAADEPIIPRRLAHGTPPVDAPAITLPDCAVIEILFIQMPSVQRKYATKYPAMPDKLDQDTIALPNVAQRALKDTVWIEDGTEFLCFNLLISGILRPAAGDSWPGNAGDTWDDAELENEDILNKMNQYIAYEKNHGTWVHDVAYAITINSAGLAGVGTMCSESATGTGGMDHGIAEWLFTHELGHNLGAWHDYEDCSDNGHGGDFGHIMGYAKRVFTFSQCSIHSIYLEWERRELDCLWTTTTTEAKSANIAQYNAVCGDDKVEGLEECDGETCCDMTTVGKRCTWQRGCCSTAGDVFECVEVQYEGSGLSIIGAGRGGNNKIPLRSGYVGYYGGCVSEAIYHEMDVVHSGRDPFVLQHTPYVKCCGSDQNADFDVLDDKEFFIITRDDKAVYTEAICLTDTAILPNLCNFRLLPPESGELTEASLTTKKVDTSHCLTPYDPKACHDNLDWTQIPKIISIDGADVHEWIFHGREAWTRTINTNGAYLRYRNECFHGMPFFVKEYLQLFYHPLENQWFISYFGAGAEHINFAKCVSTTTVASSPILEIQDLFSCTAGQWNYTEPTSDGSLGATPFQEESGMTVTDTGTTTVAWRCDDMERDCLSFAADASNMITRQWESCLDPTEVPDELVIEGASNNVLNGAYSRIPQTGLCIQEMPSFEKGNQRIVFDSNRERWLVSDYGTRDDPSINAECMSTNVIEGYQNLLSCTRGKWTTDIDGGINPECATIDCAKKSECATKEECTMKIVDLQGSVCDETPKMILDEVSIVGAPLNDVKYDLNGVYRKEKDDRTNKYQVCNGWRRPRMARYIGDGFVIHYNLNWKGKWTVYKHGSQTKEILAQCETAEVADFTGDEEHWELFVRQDLKSQDLRRCTEGEWQLFDALFEDTPGTGIDQLHNALTMRIEFSKSSLKIRWDSRPLDDLPAFGHWFGSACDKCLDWNGMHGRDNPSTISIKGLRGASAFLNGEYTRSESQECIGGLPFFTKDGPSDLRIIYDSGQEKWFVSSFDLDERTDHAYCDNVAQGRGYQDLGKCKRTKWWSLVGDQYQQAPKMRIKNMPAVKKWFLPNGGRYPCATISERLMGQGKDNVWHNFWEDAPSIFGGKQNKVKNRASKYLKNNEVSWDEVKSHMKRDACDHTEESERYMCWFVESLFDACDQLANWCGSHEKDEIIKSISSGLKRHCDSDTEFTCFVGKEDSGVSVSVSAKSIFGQTDSKGDDFWSNHVYVALIAAIFLLLAVCGYYYLRNRRNQQQTANEGNPAEYVRSDEQDAVNDLSIEDVEDYKQEMDTDGENGARPNGESQPAVDRVAHSNSVVAISLKYRN